MQRTLITFLGTGKYGETLYQWPEVGEHRTRFVAEALSKIWGATHTVVLATQKAEEMHGNDLQAAFQMAGLPAPVIHRLPDGRTEQELWDQFRILRQGVSDARDGDVLIDITHGFRAQPFFAGAVLALLRAAGLQPPSLQLVYGEYRQNEPISPIWDLSLFEELLEWAQALTLFLNTGVATTVVELGKQLKRKEADKVCAAGTRNFPRFEKLVSAIDRFAADMATIRVASIISGYGKERGSAARLLQAIKEFRQEVEAKLPPLALILDRLEASVRPLVAERLYGADGFKAQHALARHYLNLQRYPEAAVVMRELAVSQYAEDERAVEVNSANFDERQRTAAEKKFAEQDQFSCKTYGQIRNDIEHGGFRKQPQPSKALKDRVGKLVEQWAVLPTAQTGNAPPESSEKAPGRTFFVTRHPGAVQWAKSQGIVVDRTVEHLELAEVRPGDIVMGTLPVHLAEAVCSRGARYRHLVLSLTPELRGHELTAEQMTCCGACLIDYRVERQA
ncbi:MAG TPA: CRISPR-associated protein Csx16 [Terriglobia bacterium]|nr:CRISPR-associated protein Csx16 [Terriglobia bacterium]